MAAVPRPPNPGHSPSRPHRKPEGHSHSVHCIRPACHCFRHRRCSASDSSPRHTRLPGPRVSSTGEGGPEASFCPPGPPRWWPVEGQPQPRDGRADDTSCPPARQLAYPGTPATLRGTASIPLGSCGWLRHETTARRDSPEPPRPPLSPDPPFPAHPEMEDVPAPSWLPTFSGHDAAGSGVPARTCSHGRPPPTSGPCLECPCLRSLSPGPESPFLARPPRPSQFPGDGCPLGSHTLRPDPQRTIGHPAPVLSTLHGPPACHHAQYLRIFR